MPKRKSYKELSMRDLILYWSRIIRDKKSSQRDKLEASRYLAQYYKDVQENTQEDPYAEIQSMSEEELRSLATPTAEVGDPGACTSRSDPPENTESTERLATEDI